LHQVPSEELNDFTYKYVCDGTFESGNDRISDAADVEPQPEGCGKWVTTLKAVRGLISIRHAACVVLTLGQSHDWGKVSSLCMMKCGCLDRCSTDCCCAS
jgi:hypothetical protein